MKAEPNISVGIIHQPRINFTLHGKYILSQNGYPYECEQIVERHEDGILFNGDIFPEIDLIPQPGSGCYFTLGDVKIGIDFHWEQVENQSFEGILRIIPDQQILHAVNIISTEKYLASVIASEMAAGSSPALLRAHAVISRSWVLNQLLHKKKADAVSAFVTDRELVRWYDRDDHLLFDVCADDHCQRYQGTGRITSPEATKAVEETVGEVLTYKRQICDARFSKCCGGITEHFENCWDATSHPYLQPVYDHSSSLDEEKAPSLPIDLSIEENAQSWIRTAPEAFCNTSDPLILRQVLNHYDQSTHDFFRWKIIYSQDELAELIKRKSGYDFGKILDLVPLERGVSGRIVRLKIIGSKKTFIVGKELEIRRILSPSHLYSSAFVVDKAYDQENIPIRFTIRGAGWGHGVGLCQIGAAVMADSGYSYQQILKHYFRHARITCLYTFE